MWLSILISNEIKKNYECNVVKQTRELADLDFADREWRLQSYDQHGVGVVKIHYGECNKEIRGTSNKHD